MFKKFLGKKSAESEENSEEREINEKISKMNLTEMKSYINNRIDGFALTTYGLNAVLRKLIGLNDATNKHYINSDDMDSKKKKAFDLVLSTMSNSKITVESMELVQEFMDTYKEIIDTYDKENKQIYASRFEDGLKVGMLTLDKLLQMSQKTSILE